MEGDAVQTAREAALRAACTPPYPCEGVRDTSGPHPALAYVVAASASGRVKRPA